MPETDKEFLERLREALQVPVTSVKDRNPNGVRTFLGVGEIGKIPLFYFDGQFQFELTEAILGKLNWSHVYLSMKENIEHFVRLAYPEHTEISVGGWRKLILRKPNSKDEAITVECSYDGREWSVREISGNDLATI